MHLELMPGLSLSSLQRRTFAEFHSRPLNLLFWNPLKVFFCRTISRTFSLPTQFLSWCFSLEPFAQFHPVAGCLSPSFGWKKADLPFSNSTRTTKWASTNSLISYPDLTLSLEMWDLVKFDFEHAQCQRGWKYGLFFHCACSYSLLWFWVILGDFAE